MLRPWCVERPVFVFIFYYYKNERKKKVTGGFCKEVVLAVAIAVMKRCTHERVT